MLLACTLFIKIPGTTYCCPHLAITNVLSTIGLIRLLFLRKVNPRGGDAWVPRHSFSILAKMPTPGGGGSGWVGSHAGTEKCLG